MRNWKAEAARFFGSERTLYMGSGFAANLAVLSTLQQPGDLILYDALVHASAHDGMRASRAECQGIAHNDANAFEAAISRWRQAGGNGQVWIVVESLYSMDGDMAPLVDLAAIADRHQAFWWWMRRMPLVCTVPMGADFQPIWKAARMSVVIHTCGKALGSAGALVSACGVLCDYLVNRARPFIYATAPSPLQALGVHHALRMVQSQPERRQALHDLVRHANGLIAEQLGIATSGTQIIPVIVGEDAKAVRIARRLQAQGFDIRAIRPPTVPARTARLRITITLNVDRETVERMVDHLVQIMENEV